MSKHLVIYGPPGTGKTRALVGHVTEHLQANRGRVLFCSHTRAAAQTAIERFGVESPQLDISTLHSYCFKELGLNRVQTVDDRKLRYFSEEFGLDMDDNGDGRQYVEIMSFAHNTIIEPIDAYNNSNRPGSVKHFQAFVKSYHDWKKQFGYVDFADMLINYSAKAKKPSGQTLLVIDEAQDLTPLHWLVVGRFMILHPDTRVIIAGDDDQCIYGYSGADAHGAERFAKYYDAETQVLDQSYRIPATVHNVANQIAARMSKRVDKVYRPREGVGQYATYQQFGSAPLEGETLILYSDRFVRKEEVEPELMEACVPYTAINGFPAPLQSKAGKALRAAHKEGELSDADWTDIRNGLSEHGRSVYNVVDREAVRDRLRKFDMRLLEYHYSIGDYLQRINFQEPVTTRISTIHGAKGMEADNVHIITRQSDSAVAYSFRDPDASHRVFYVGTTRARNSLNVYWGNQNNYEIPGLN